MLCLLTPVPYVHLASARDAGRTTAVFGTRVVEVFRQLDERGGIDVPVLFYASHMEGPFRPVVTWRGELDNWADAVGNGLPKREWRFDRPPTTFEEDRTAGHWYAHYRVTDLRELSPSDEIGFDRMCSATTGKQLAATYVPEGPLLVMMTGDRT